MPSTLRTATPHKRNPFMVATRLAQVGRDLEDASTGVVEALRRDAEEYARLRDSALEQLNERGLQVPQMVPLTCTHSAVPHPHELLCVVPARAITQIRELSDRLRLIEASAPPGGELVAPFSLRRERVRGTKTIDVLPMINPLMEWVAGEAPELAQMPVEVVAAMHFDILGPTNSQVTTERRKLGAVCRSIWEWLEVRDSPLKEAVRCFAAQILDSSRDLLAIAKRLQDAKSPLLHGITVELTALAKELLALDEKLRPTCLARPADCHGRGTSPSASTLIAVCQQLKSAGFSEIEIASLVPVEGALHMRGRAKRVRTSLASHAGTDFRTWFIGSVNAADEEPVAD
ncbi:MAG: hypothetical protein SFV15_16335 [Polyangiaceae bacterium]|nr:hypothetical protein [Polyangiaceae bacterium]